MAQQIKKLNMPMSESVTRLRQEEDANPNTQQYSRTAAAPGPEVAHDGGSYSKPDATTQAAMELKTKYMMQNSEQNTATAESAGNANQQRQAELMSTEDSGAKTKAQMQLQENIALQYYAGAPSTQTFKLSDPEFASRVYDSVARAKSDRDQLMGMG